MTIPPASRSNTEALSRDVSFLGRILGDVLREQGGDALFNAVEQLRIACRDLRVEPSDDRREMVLRAVDALPLDLAVQVVRAFTAYFHLINMAEEHHRLRRLRDRERERQPAPRDQSIGATIAALHAAGADAGEVHDLLRSLAIQPVFTAHPTEARRMTMLRHLRRISQDVESLGRADLLDRERGRLIDRLYAEITDLWQTNELRTRQQTVLDEVENGLYYLDAGVFDVVPDLYRDLRESLVQWYPELQCGDYQILSFGSWIGGDRDGNPNVTPEVTEIALRMHRALALSRYMESVEELADRLSPSTSLVGVSSELRTSLDRDQQAFGARATAVASRSPNELYRQKLAYMAARLTATYARNGISWAGRVIAPTDVADPGYAQPDEFLADLREISDSLQANGGRRVADVMVGDLIRQVQVFGFHMARLDVRQHRDRHVAALDEVLAAGGVCAGFRSRDEAGRVTALDLALHMAPGPIDEMMFSPETRETLETFNAIARMQNEIGREAVDTVIVSFTTDPSDLLGVLVLARLAGLIELERGVSRVQVVPLFETEQDLERAPGILRRLTAHPLYRRQLALWDNRQQIMIGYSDSDKDAGYLSANWWLYRAQQELVRAGDEAGIAVTFFHGRGGAIGRGGGPLPRAILGQPSDTVRGRIRVTEQGEVLFTRYANPGIAYRHLEQVVNAVIVASSSRLARPPKRVEVWETLTGDMSRRASRAYRELVNDDPEFIAFFDEGTPLRSITRLRLASRPARRSSDQFRLADLRAIPWVFAWTQSRYGVPGWYGLGTALDGAIEAGKLDMLQEMYREWPFFRWLIDAVQISLGKADLNVAGAYGALVRDETARRTYTEKLDVAFRQTVETINSVVGQDHLLDSWPLLQRSIALRNPYVDPMSFLQIRAIREVREETDDARADVLRSIIDRSVHGIAAGLQNTG